MNILIILHHYTHSFAHLNPKAFLLHGRILETYFFFRITAYQIFKTLSIFNSTIDGFIILFCSLSYVSSGIKRFPYCSLMSERKLYCPLTIMNQIFISAYNIAVMYSVFFNFKHLINYFNSI